MALCWLHISDFHIRAGDPYDRDVVLRALVASVRRHRERGTAAPQLVFATGDVAHSGKEGEYEIATRLFDDLLEAAGLDRGRLFVIPGNHDVDRDRGIGLASTLASREEADRYFAPDAPKPHLTLKQAAFRDWYASYFDGVRTCPATTCGPVEQVTAGDARVAVLPINSALFCQDDDDHGRLCVGRRALDGALAELRELEADLRVALVHHPLEWLSDVERANVRAALAEHVDVILRGHLHETDVETAVSPHGSVVSLAAGAAYQSRRWPNRALYTTFDGSRLRILPVRYEDAPREMWTLDPTLFPDADGYVGTVELRPAPAAPDEPPARPGTRTRAAPGRVPSNVPSRRGLPFEGRDRELELIRDALGEVEAERVAVLTGPPGVGKSELAREYARTARERYPGGTFVVDATDASVPVDLARIGANALALQFAEGSSIEDQCEQTLLALAEPTLLVYDNVGSLDAIERWLPPAGAPCHVLITTVRQPREPGWSPIPVEPLSHPASIDVVRALAGEDVAARYGDELAEHAGGFPVQLCPAAAVVAYEERRGRRASAHRALAGPAHASFQPVYDRLEEDARVLLHAAAGLNPQRIARAELVGSLTDALEWSKARCERALDACADLHLLEGDDELVMHQLFAAFVGAAAPPAGIDRVRRSQGERLTAAAWAVVERPNDGELAARLTGFALAPVVWDGVSAVDASGIGSALKELGQFERALGWLELKLAGDRERGADPRSVAVTLHQTGDCLCALGHFARALERFEQAVETKRQPDRDGRIDHQELGLSLHQVGYCHSSPGDFERALPWFEQAVEEMRQGDLEGRVDHQRLGTSLHQVGYCHSSQGDYEGALPWFEEAVEEARRGDATGRINHSGLGKSLHQIGFCHSLLGDDREALGWFEQAVDEKRRGDVHGRVDHENVAVSLHEVGFCHGRLGEPDRALESFQQAVEARRRGDVYGRVDRQGLGVSLHQVGYSYAELGDPERALEWFERARVEVAHGDLHGRVDHRDLAATLNCIGHCHSGLGDEERALGWYERAVAEARSGDLHGRLDPEALAMALRAAAACLRRLGRLALAEEREAEADRLAADD